MIFYIPGGRRNTFLDGSQNYLKLTIKNSDTTNTLSFDHHGSCVINRTDIFHGSALLETIQAYNVLMNYLCYCLRYVKYVGLSHWFWNRCTC